MAKDTVGQSDLWASASTRPIFKGKVLYTIGNVDKEDSTHQKFTWTNWAPTWPMAPNQVTSTSWMATAAQIVSRFDKNFKHLKTIGGRADKDAPKGTRRPAPRHLQHLPRRVVNTLKK